MRHILFAPQQPTYDVAILIKPSNFNDLDLKMHYVDPLVSQGIPVNQIIAFDLDYQAKKVNATTIKQYLAQLLPVLRDLGVKYIYCADASYFKALVKTTKADPYFGYVLPCKQTGFDYMQVVLGLNFGALIHNPAQYSKIDMSLKTLSSVYLGQYVALGQNVIQHEDYPDNLQRIEWFLNSLHEHAKLTCDIEAFSLNLFDAYLGSIAFAWDEHSGGSFLVDYKSLPNPTSDMQYGECVVNPEVRNLLKLFFEKYKGELIFHNATYDIKVLVLNLFMKHPQDYEGMLHGLDVLCRGAHDTKMIAYLSLNTTSEIDLALKGLAHEYLGNYAQANINNIKFIKAKDLLQYNLLDCLGTWFVYRKYYPVMLRDNQLDIYNSIMLPTLKVVLQMELVGMPLYPEKVIEVETELQAKELQYREILSNSPSVKAAQYRLQMDELTKINASLKVKQHGMDKVANYVFNPGSSLHLRVLLHSVMGLPVIDYTPTKEPATGADSIEKLLNHATDPEHVEVLNTIIRLGKISKILSTFIPAFKNATTKQDGMGYLHANFNINGTVSGRMSCNRPNLQQIPSNSEFAKPIKKCFNAPKGWLFCSADFNALEAKVDALLTRDPAKIAVYTDGYDSHAYNAYYYWQTKFPEVKLLPQGTNLRAFKLLIDGVYHTVLEGEIIETPQGTLMKIEDYYDE